MRIVDLHCYPGTKEWIASQGPYVEALAKYWKRDWVGKPEDEVVKEFEGAGVEACLVVQHRRERCPEGDRGEHQREERAHDARQPLRRQRPLQSRHREYVDDERRLIDPDLVMEAMTDLEPYRF